jgi:hypothetical protein
MVEFRLLIPDWLIHGLKKLEETQVILAKLNRTPG